jgi:ketosteroid isomerase-like protein
MSANLDLVRSIYAAWERGDWFSSADWAHPEMELVSVDGPEPGTWSGLDVIVAAWRDVLSVWDDLRTEAEEYRELDDERVLVLFHRSGRGRISGLEFGQMRTQGANLSHIRDGMVTRVVSYWDRERAFADLGLAPEADSP